jgi:prevent-host-death family protein
LFIGKTFMHSINAAVLKNQLSKYLALAKAGEEVVICDRGLPVAKLIPFSTEDASEEELLLVAAGRLRLPKNSIKVDELLRIRTARLQRAKGSKHCLRNALCGYDKQFVKLQTGASFNTLSKMKFYAETSDPTFSPVTTRLILP